MKTAILISLVLALASAGVSKTKYVIEIENVLEAGIRTVSAYTIGRVEETDDTPCIGAYNHNLCELVKNGTNVCASNEFPKGTVLRLVELNMDCIVLDRMNCRYTTGIDLAGLDYQKNIEFGRKGVSVLIK
mgnify:CR=1 FL=1